MTTFRRRLRIPRPFSEFEGSKQGKKMMPTGFIRWASLAMPCQALPYQALPNQVPSHASPRPALTSHTWPCHASFPATPCPASPSPASPCHARPFPDCPTLRRLALPCQYATNQSLTANPRLDLSVYVTHNLVHFGDNSCEFSEPPVFCLKAFHITLCVL